MSMRRQLIGAALGVGLALAPDAARGQVVAVWSARPALEGQYTQLRFAADGQSARAEGLGGRLMWHAAPVLGAPSTLVGRASAGLFAAHTPEQGLGFSTTQLGVVADVRPFAPLGGRVEPFLSLGAGALRTSVLPGRGAAGAALTPLAERSNTAFALTPGVGARVHVLPGLAVHATARDLVAFRGGAQRMLAWGAGVRMER